MARQRRLRLTISLLALLIGPAALAERSICWTDKDTAKIQRLRLDGGTVEDVLTGADGLVDPRGIAIDPYRRKMYWADAGTGKIHRATLDGAGVIDLVTGLQFPADVELDLWENKIYWAERDGNRIRRTDLDGTGSPEDVTTGTLQPYYVALDLVAGQIYWTDFDNTVIHRANLDGTAPVEMFTTGIVRARDVALDIPDGRIYWGDRDASKIQRTYLSGMAAIEDLFGAADGLDRPHGLALDPTSGTMYWTDTRTHAIHRGRMDGTGSAETLVPGLAGPWGIVLHEDPPRPAFRNGNVVGALGPSDLREASGLVASRQNAGVLWSHNDHGGSARIFALGADGKDLGVYNLVDAGSYDYEDIAIGPGPAAETDYLYVGDIGDNNAARNSVVVYRVVEPPVQTDQAPTTGNLNGVASIRLRYPGGPRNAETLIVDPDSGDVFIVSKSTAPAQVYRAAFPQSTTDTTTMELVATFDVDWRPAIVLPIIVGATGGDISPAGDMILIRGYWIAYLWVRRPGTALWEAFDRPPEAVAFATAPGDSWYQEAICFEPHATGYYAVSEGVNAPIYYFERIVGTTAACKHWDLY